MNQQKIIEETIVKGKKFVNNGLYKKALKLYLSAYKNNIQNYTLLYEIANTYYTIKDHKKALKFAIKLEELDSDHYENTLLLGKINLELENLDNALKYFEKACSINLIDYLVYYLLGFTYYKMKNYKKAESALIKSIEMNTNHSSSYYSLGYAYLNQDKEYKAEETFRNFLDIETEGSRSEEIKKLVEKRFNITLHLPPELLQDKVAGSAYYSFGLVKALWRSEKHRKEFPNALKYEYTINEELDAYNSLAQIWFELKENHPLIKNYQLDTLLKVYKDNYMDCFVYEKFKQEFPQEYKSWINENSDLINRYYKYREIHQINEDDLS